MTDPTPRAREEGDTVTIPRALAHRADGLLSLIAHRYRTNATLPQDLCDDLIATSSEFRRIAALRAVPVLHRDLPAPAYSGDPVTPTPQDHEQAVREALDEYESALVAGAEFRHQREAVRAARDALLAAVRAQAVAEERARWAVAEQALREIAGGPVQEGLCQSPTRRWEHLTMPCPHCKARKALAALTPTPRGPTDGE